MKHSDQVIVEAALIGKHLQKNSLMRLCYRDIDALHFITSSKTDVTPLNMGAGRLV